VHFYVTCRDWRHTRFVWICVNYNTLSKILVSWCNTSVWRSRFQSGTLKGQHVIAGKDTITGTYRSGATSQPVLTTPDSKGPEAGRLRHMPACSQRCIWEDGYAKLLTTTLDRPKECSLSFDSRKISRYILTQLWLSTRAVMCECRADTDPYRPVWMFTGS